VSAKPVSMRQQHMNLTRQTLVDAARGLFLGKGFRDTTIDEISRAAGTSRVTFYAHFNDKQDVLRALGMFMWDTNLALFSAFGTLPDWSRKSVGGWVDMMMTAYEREWALGKMLWAELPALGLEMMPHVDQWVEAMMAGTDRWQRFTPQEGRVRAYLMIFQINRALSAWQGVGWKQDRGSLHETLTNVWLLTLGESPGKSGAAKQKTAHAKTLAPKPKQRSSVKKR